MTNWLGKIKSVDSYHDVGQIVWLRVDYNTPNPGGADFDDTRIMSSLPTLDYLLKLNSKVLILAHKGRPAGKPDVGESMQPIAEYLAEKLSRKFIVIENESHTLPSYPVPHVFFYKGDIRQLSRQKIEAELQPGNILFVENIRFYKEEEAQDQEFALKLSALGDVFINEAFSVVHHASTSTVNLPKLLPHFAGYQLIKEITALEHLRQNCAKPLVLVIGGAKIAEKAKMLRNLLPQADSLLVGGAMANLFFKVKDYAIGDSVYDQAGVHQAGELLRNFKEKIFLPSDVIVSRQDLEQGEKKPATKVRPGEKIVDIGPEAILTFSQKIKLAKTIIWNGPLGLFEQKPFGHGTAALARLIASRGKSLAYVAVGGGETLQALNQVKMNDSIDFISTGGGAMLAFLGGEELPGLEAIRSNV